MKKDIQCVVIKAEFAPPFDLPGQDSLACSVLFDYQGYAVNPVWLQEIEEPCGLVESWIARTLDEEFPEWVSCKQLIIVTWGDGIEDGLCD